MDGNLMVSPHKVDFGKDGAAGSGLVLYVWDWIPVSLHMASNCCHSWAQDVGEMTMDPRRVWLYRPAAWR
jgi:hypothetical protein